jgi:hypothetical protein
MGKKFSDMSTKELKDMALGLHDAIYGADSYSCSDIHNYESAIVELEKRGFAVSQKLVISKE